MVEERDTLGGVFSEDDYKKDGGLKKAAVRRLEDEAPARGSARSFNEVTGETTVTTTLGGQTVTYVEDGDTTDKADIRESDKPGENRPFEPGAGSAGEGA